MCSITHIGDRIQLTMFPTISKSSEPYFRLISTILGKHFFQHRLFDFSQFVILTLMKGDKGIKITEIVSDSLLF